MLGRRIQEKVIDTAWINAAFGLPQVQMHCRQSSTLHRNFREVTCYSWLLQSVTACRC